MVLGMSEENTRLESFTYADRDAYTALSSARPGRRPLDNRDAAVFEAQYRPASRSLIGLNPVVPTRDGAAISKGEANDATAEYCAQEDALRSLIDAVYRTANASQLSDLTRSYPYAVHHLDEGWVEFKISPPSSVVRLMPGEGYDFARLRKVPLHSPSPDRSNFVPYTEVKALLNSRKETDDAG